MDNDKWWSIELDLYYDLEDHWHAGDHDSDTVHLVTFKWPLAFLHFVPCFLPHILNHGCACIIITSIYVDHFLFLFTFPSIKSFSIPPSALITCLKCNKSQFQYLLRCNLFILSLIHPINHSFILIHSFVFLSTYQILPTSPLSSHLLPSHPFLFHSLPSHPNHRWYSLACYDAHVTSLVHVFVITPVSRRGVLLLSGVSCLPMDRILK